MYGFMKLPAWRGFVGAIAINLIASGAVCNWANAVFD
jgi:hypothetical protein